MSYPLLTIPISMAKGLHKSPSFNTLMAEDQADVGNAAIGLKPYPTWDFELSTGVITGNEADATSTAAALMGTFIACGGRNGLFLFTDPQDSAVLQGTSALLDVTAGSATPMSQTGNGTSKQFQTARLIGGIGVDLLQNVSITQVFVNGVLKSLGSDYSINATGVITFASAPASNATLAWSGTFQYLCRFAKDQWDAIRSFTTNSGTDQWNISDVAFSSEFV